MNTKTLTLIVILFVILLFGGCACSRYNGLVTADQSVNQTWGNVQTQYQRRTDLYNSIIHTIEGSANFEKSTLKEVIAARASATAVKVTSTTPLPSVNINARRPNCKASSAA